MIEHNPTDRCGLNAILSHYYFWPGKKCLLFVNAANRACKMLKENNDRTLLDDLNAYHSISIGYKDWRRAVPFEIYRNQTTKKFRNSTRDLIKAIANSPKCNNFQKSSNSLWKIWSAKFPCLLPFIYGILQDVSHPPLRKFYQNNTELPKFHKLILGS